MARKETADKEVRKDAKLQNLVLRDKQAYEDLWRFRYPEEGGTKLGFDEILIEIPKLYGFTVSLSTLSNFYDWFKVRKSIDDDADFSEQFMQELAKKDSFTPTQIREAGQKLFTLRSIRNENPKEFRDIAMLGQDEERLKQNDKRIAVSKESVSIQERRISLLEEKAAEAKAKLVALTTSGKSKGGITPETLALIEEAARLL